MGRVTTQEGEETFYGSAGKGVRTGFAQGGLVGTARGGPTPLMRTAEGLMEDVEGEVEVLRVEALAEEKFFAEGVARGERHGDEIQDLEF